MSDDNSLMTIFVDECEDLLSEISEGFGILESDHSDVAALNAIFRGVHSIKGGAGSFQMEEVVRFAHTFETALDKVRNGLSELNNDTVVVLLRSSDCLAAVLDAAFSENEHDEAFCSEMEAALKEAFDISEETDETIEFDVVPVIFDLDDSGSFDDSEDDAPQEPNLDLPELPPLDELVKPVGNDEETDGAQLADVPEPPNQAMQQALSKDGAPADKASVATAKPTDRSATKTVRSTLRVDADRIDLLINTVGELIINQSTILERFKLIEQKSDAAIDVALDEYRQLTSELQERVLAIRAQPVKSLFQRMSRVVREVSSTGGKPARLVTTGDDTEVDKTLVESLAEPLTHMIRNSVDHGLEDSDVRKSLGKSATGVVKLSAYHASGNVVIEIADDGAGLNRAKIKDIAIKKGLVSAEADLSTSEIDRLLFMPGFSTADKVSDLSGRGVGMDVVKNAITKLGGSITTTSTQGMGTKFKVAVPLTLAVMDGMIVRVGSETMVLPTSCVVETVKLSDSLTNDYGHAKRVFRFRDVFLPIVPVASALGLPEHRRTENSTKLLVIVKLKDDSLVALELDGVLDRRQLVIKGLETNCGRLTGVSSAAVLGDGKLVLIIDPDAVIETQSALLVMDSRPCINGEDAHVG